MIHLIQIGRICRKHIAVFTILLSFPIVGYSQGTDLSEGGKGRFFIGFSISPGRSTLTNNAPSTLTRLNSMGKSSFSFTAEAGFMLSDYFGISSGAGYTTLKSEIMAGSYTTNYDTTDATESYRRFITGDNIKESQEISFFKIPLLLNIHIPAGKKLGIFLHPGLNFMMPLSNNYKNSGKFTYEGYYSAYNVRITGVPYEGFEKDYSTSDQGELKIKSLNIGLTLSGGVQFMFQEKIQLAISMAYEKLFSDISDYPGVQNYRLSSNPGQMKSIMEGSSGTTASSLGLGISIRIFL